jgi:hypothetical protein
MEEVSVASKKIQIDQYEVRGEESLDYSELPAVLGSLVFNAYYFLVKITVVPDGAENAIQEPKCFFVKLSEVPLLVERAKSFDFCIWVSKTQSSLSEPVTRSAIFLYDGKVQCVHEKILQKKAKSSVEDKRLYDSLLGAKSYTCQGDGFSFDHGSQVYLDMIYFLVAKYHQVVPMSNTFMERLRAHVSNVFSHNRTTGVSDERFNRNIADKDAVIAEYNKNIALLEKSKKVYLMEKTVLIEQQQKFKDQAKMAYENKAFPEEV